VDLLDPLVFHIVALRAQLKFSIKIGKNECDPAGVSTRIRGDLSKSEPARRRLGPGFFHEKSPGED
jgi:hypothetical protein